MQTIKFTSLRGTELTGQVLEKLNINGELVYTVRALSKIYAIVDGYSVLEMPDDTNQIEFNKLIIKEL